VDPQEMRQTQKVTRGRIALTRSPRMHRAGASRGRDGAPFERMTVLRNQMGEVGAGRGERTRRL